MGEAVDMGLGMAALIGLWLGLTAIYVGLGAWVLRCAGRRISSPDDAFLAFWLGWASTMPVLQVWHFFAPIGPACIAMFAGAGALGLWLERGAVGAALRALRARFEAAPGATRWLALAGGLALLWLANRAMGPVTPQGDAGLYHIGSIRWMQAEALLPGIANVDGHFGFNNASHLFLAMLDFVGPPPRYYHLGSPLLLAVFFLQTLRQLWLVRGDGGAAEPHRYLACLWPGAFVPYFFMEIAGSSADTVCLMIGLVVGTQLFRMVFEPEAEPGPGFGAFVVIFLSTVGVIIKLSFAFFGFFACAAAAICFVRAGSRATWRPRLRAHAGRIAALGVFVLVVLGCWTVRGVVQSGYVAFPSSALLAIDVDWRVPETERVHENDNIKAWAREPNHTRPAREVSADWRWFWPWLAHSAQRVDLFTAPMLLFFGAAIAWLRRARKERRDWKSAALFLAPAAIAFVLWFVTAPAERFGGAIFWLLGGGAIAIHFAQTTSTEARARMVHITVRAVTLSLVVAFVVGAVFSRARYGWALVVPPGVEHGFHPIPAVTTRPFETESGVRVNIVTGATAPGTKWTPQSFCWDAPLPCMTSPRPELERRASGDPSMGYRTGGSP